MMIVNISFSWAKPVSKVLNRITGGEKAQLFMANECKRQMDPYVPADNLILAQNTRVFVENGSGVVEYNSPYAHYQWEGELYVSSATGSAWASGGEYKVPAGKELEHSKFRHPLATSHWEEAMWTAKRDAVERAVQQYLNGGAR